MHTVQTFVKNENKKYNDNPITKNNIKTLGLDQRDQDMFSMCNQKATAEKLAIKLYNQLEECFKVLPVGSIRKDTAELLKSIDCNIL